jgi:hypothetical protein
MKIRFRFVLILGLSISICGCSEPKHTDPAPSGPIVEVVEPQGAYETGWHRGYAAYLQQAGIATTALPVTTSYTIASEGEEPSPESEEESAAGYTDGYHRASEAFVCPYSGASHR